MSKRCVLVLLILSFIAVSACSSGGCKTANTANEKELTVGVVQKEIHTGMSGAEVAEALGSPNIVTKDSSEKETWIYDRIATEVSYTKKGIWGTIIILSLSKETGSASMSQKTLTVVIKFNKSGKVETVTYHASKF